MHLGYRVKKKTARVCGSVKGCCDDIFGFDGVDRTQERVCVGGQRIVQKTIGKRAVFWMLQNRILGKPSMHTRVVQELLDPRIVQMELWEMPKSNLTAFLYFMLYVS